MDKWKSKKLLQEFFEVDRSFVRKLQEQTSLVYRLFYRGYWKSLSFMKRDRR